MSTNPHPTTKNINVGPLDAAFLSTDFKDRSLFNYLGYQTNTNYGFDVVDVDPTNSSNVGFGKTTNYSIPLSGSFLGKIVRHITLGAGTGGTAATYSRFVDGLGLAISSEVSYKYGVQSLPKYYDHEIYAWYVKKLMTREEQEAVQDLLQVNKTPAERDFLFINGQDLIVEVPSWFDSDPRLYLHQHSLAQELSLSFTNRTMTEVIDTDATSPPTVASFTEKLHCLFYHVSNAESDYHTAEEMVNVGVVQKIDMIQRIAQATVASGSTNASIDISNLTYPSRALVIIARPSATTTSTSLSQANDFYDFQKIDKIELTSAAGTFYNQQDDIFNRLWFQSQLFPAPPGAYIYVCDWAMDPNDHFDCNGHLTFGSFTNPLAKLTWNSAISQEYVVDIFSIGMNLLQRARGNMKLIVD